MWTVVALSRRLLVLALVAGLTSMHVQAAALHVHATVGIDGHHHGPASHHHDDKDHRSSGSLQVFGVDADDTVVHVALVAAPAQSVTPIQSEHESAPSLDLGAPSIVEDTPIVARAHGPPSAVQHPLRAPPTLPSL